MTAQIITPVDFLGRHNSDLEGSQARLTRGQQWRDLSTVIVVPTRGGAAFSAKWVSSLQSLIRPMNNRVVGPIFMQGMEVGVAYNEAIKMIQQQMPDYRYMLAWEDDVIPQPDTLLKLYEHIDDYDVVGALYWTKGEGGQPMIYGDASDHNVNYRPQVPNGGLHRCYGTGMGFTLFKMEQFKRVEPPWFETQNRWDPSSGIAIGTQDLNYYGKLTKAGGTIVVNCEARAGHYDHMSDVIW